MLNGKEIPDRNVPPVAERILRGLVYNRAAGRNPPEHWRTTLRDAPRDGAVREDIKRLAAQALAEPPLKEILPV